MPTSAKGSETVQKILRTFSTTVRSLAELRNELDLGHGRSTPSPALTRHARLAHNSIVTVTVAAGRLARPGRLGRPKFVILANAHVDVAQSCWTGLMLSVAHPLAAGPEPDNSGDVTTVLSISSLTVGSSPWRAASTPSRGHRRGDDVPSLWASGRGANRGRLTGIARTTASRAAWAAANRSTTATRCRIGLDTKS